MTDPLFNIADQVVLVSGGSRGIGRELAAAFAARDAMVFIAGREADTLETTAGVISTGRYPVKTVVCDVSLTDDVASMVQSVVSEAGRIDGLLNVAGVNKRKRVENYAPEEFDFIVDINLRGAFFVAQHVGRQFIAQGNGGWITNIDSLNTSSPLKGVLPYAMSKAGMNMMTRGMANEWGRHKVRVNGLAPGFVLTDLTQKLWSDPNMQAWNAANSPLGRLGNPDDMVGTAVFLASPGAAFLTGQTIYVDGGFTAGMNWPIPLD